MNLCVSNEYISKREILSFLTFKVYFCYNTEKKKKKKRNGESLPLENFNSVIATDAETDTSLMMTVTCLTLSIKSLPLIRVNVYGTLRGVREERGIEKRGRREERRRKGKHLKRRSVTV